MKEHDNVLDCFKAFVHRNEFTLVFLLAGFHVLLAGMQARTSGGTDLHPLIG